LEESEFIQNTVFKTCNSCRKKKKTSRTIQDCQSLAATRGGKCLSTEYKDNISKMRWECASKHEWSTSFTSIKKGTWCSKCVIRLGNNIRLKLEDCQAFVEAKGGKCLSTQYTSTGSRMLWQCSEKHEWITAFNNIKRGSWCPHCAGKAQLTIEECQTVAEAKGGKCLSTEYKGNKSKMTWQCEKKHEWSSDTHHIKGGKWCPRCSGSKSEELCRTIIEKYLCEPFPNLRPKFLEGLELDGYNKDLNIAFEYNGKQHYEYIEHFHRGDPERFEKQKERDLKKYAICRERNINLIIIPYQYDYLKPHLLEDFIFDALWKIS
jgi:hypothetical protein